MLQDLPLGIMSEANNPPLSALALKAGQLQGSPVFCFYADGLNNIEIVLNIQ